jgi:hypothetical protein
MKTIKTLFVTFIIVSTITSCSNSLDQPYIPTLEDVITKYDLWYVDYNRTEGVGDVPFLSKAFTISFINGNLYANNNIVGIGFTGDGYGIQIGYYDSNKGFLEIDHDLDGFYDFDVFEISPTSLKLIDNYNKVTYYLEGYYNSTFDFDQVFYDNIEYFLQEYVAWEKYAVSGGVENVFDYENFLKFTPENITTFYSSQDDFGTDLDNIFWDYIGDYEVFDVEGIDNLKYLTLNYGSGDIEAFDLTVIDDETISLYHLTSETTYEFSGKGFIQYLKPNSEKESVRNDGRKRTKINRKTVDNKRNLK